jgi:hypothetical protein
MTDTETKLVDCKTQLDLALANIANYDVFRSCINAFISNGRSVTFAMQQESSDRPSFSTWYAAKRAQMKSDPLLRFFNEQRTVSIHRRSVQPDQRTVPIAHIAVAGRIVGEGGVVETYEFVEYREQVPGDSGNVIRLCRQYLEFLDTLVREWKKVIL